MTRFHVLTSLPEPHLWVWRDRTERAPSPRACDADRQGVDANGLPVFEAHLDSQLHERVHAQLRSGEGWDAKERDEHRKTLPRAAHYRFPSDLWCAEGAARVLTADPFATSQPKLRVHLVTAHRYRGGKLIAWSPGRQPRALNAAGEDALGPLFDLDLEGLERHLLLFKFQSAQGTVEPEHAHRFWCAQDGAEVWVHSRSSWISSRSPRLKSLVVRLLDLGEPTSAPQMHLWQEGSDFSSTVAGAREAGGWVRFEHLVYTERPYHFMFVDPGLEPAWEHEEARRNVLLKDTGDAWTLDGEGRMRLLGRSGIWTLEGDHQLFGREPARDRPVQLEVAHRAPECALSGPLLADVWVNRARRPLEVGLRPGPDGLWSFKAYPEVVTSFRFRCAEGPEPVARHTYKVPDSLPHTTRLFAVLGREDPVPRRPPADLFGDPPFPIERPGAWVADGHVRFALCCPAASTVEVIGEWTGWEREPLALRSTLDGSLWWGQVPLSSVAAKLDRPSVHGALYKYVLNQVRPMRDPAAGASEGPDPEAPSRLVDHGPHRASGDSRQAPSAAIG